jgi:uncharacterized SAM-binding protein YcdF (DUF218 family)
VSISRRQRHHQHTRHKQPHSLLKFKLASLGVLLLGVSVVCWIGYRHLKSHLSEPQAMLVLGGATEREVFAAQMATKYPDLEIWISGGSNPEYAEWVFTEAGVDLTRVHLDDRAVDTVTNFTTLVDQFKAQGIDNLYLVTSDYHMRRAQVIGEIVLGSRGITFRTMPVPSHETPEPLEKAIRDGVRAVLWVTTGRTGSTLSQYLPHWEQGSRGVGEHLEQGR